MVQFKMAFAQRYRTNGVLLLIVLVSLVILAAAMTQIAMRTSQIQRARLRSLDALQTRWGRLSCEAAVLPKAEGIFLSSDARTPKTRGQRVAMPHQIADRIALGGQRFDLIVADESAKANLNSIFDRDGSREVEKALQDLAGLAASGTVSLRPQRPSLATFTATDAQQRPSQLGGGLSDTTTERLGETDQGDDDASGLDPLDRYSVPPALVSWGDVFDFQQLRQATGDVRSLAEITRHLTLFGESRLNVWRASDDAIVATTRGLVQNGLARRIVARLRTTSVSEVGLVLQQTVSNAADRNELGRRLGDTSSTFSVWIESTSPTQRRQWWTIRSIDPNTGDAATRSFTYP